MVNKPFSIIGLDPGTTAAYAVLGLNGEILKLFSAKELPLSEIISQIIQISHPLITATDKAKVPALVEEFSRKLGTALVAPSADLSREEKRGLNKEFFPYEKLFQNTHESDSFAAALYAYKKYLPRLKKIEQYIVEHKIEKLHQEFTLWAIKEESLSFQKILEILTHSNEENEIVRKVVEEKRVNTKDFWKLYEKLAGEKEKNAYLRRERERLQLENSRFQKENRKLSQRRKSFDQRVDTLLKFKEERMKWQSQTLSGKEKQMMELQQKIFSLYQFIEEVPHCLLLKKVDSLGERELSAKNLKINDGDVLLVSNPHSYSEQALKQLEGKDLIIVSLVKISRVIQQKFPTAMLAPDDLISSNEHFALIKPEVLQKKLSEKIVLDEMVKEYQEERKREK